MKKESIYIKKLREIVKTGERFGESIIYSPPLSEAKKEDERRGVRRGKWKKLKKELDGMAVSDLRALSQSFDVQKERFGILFLEFEGLSRVKRMAKSVMMKKIDRIFKVVEDERLTSTRRAKK